MIPIADDAVLSAELVLDDSSALAVVENVGSALSEATNIDVNVGGEGAGAATQQVQQLGSAAEKTSGQLKGATDSTALLSGAAGIATGSTGGLRGVVGGLGLGAVGAVAGVTALAGGVKALFDAGVSAQGALDRFNATFGKMADSARQVNVGNLNKDLGDLAITLGSDDEAALSAAASVYQLGTNSGLSSDQAMQMEKNIAALAARSVALKPSLGDVGSVMEQMSVRLARGGVFAARLGVSLTQAEIAAKAAELGLKGVDGQLSAGEKSFAASVIAAEKYGNTLNQTVAKGAQNSIIQQRSLKEQIDNFIEDAGKPLIVPLFSVIRAGMPVVGALASSLSALAQGALPAVAAAATATAAPLQLLAGAVRFLQPAIGPAIDAWLAYLAVARLVPAVMSAVGTAVTTTLVAVTGEGVAAGAAITAFGASLSGLAMVAAVTVGVAALADALGAFPDSTYDAAAAVKSLGQAADDVQVPLFNATAAALAFTKNIPLAAAQLSLFQTVAEGNVGTAQRLARNLGAQGENIEKYRKVLSDYVTVQRRVNKDTQAGTDALNGNADAADNAATATDKFVAAQQAVADAVKAATDAIDEQWNADLRLRKATEDADSAYESYKKALTSGDTAAAASAQRDLEEKILGVATAAGTVAANALGNLASEHDRNIASARGQIFALEGLKAKFPELAPVIQPFLDKLNQVEGVRTATIVADTSQATPAAQEFLNTLNNIRDVQMMIAFAGGTPRGAQHGVLVPGRPGDVVPILAHPGERILSADETRRGWGGGASVIVQGSTFQFNQPIYGVNELERAMRDMLAEHDRQLEQKLRVMR